MNRRFSGSVFKSPSSQRELVPIPSEFMVSSQGLSFVDELGEGSSARVYRGSFNNSTVALKKFKLAKNIPKYETILKKEALSLLSLKHSNVLKCLGVCVSEMTLILEYCGKSFEVNGNNITCHTLRQLIDALGSVFPEDLKLEALYQTAQGMNYLHQNSIVHCDLKSQNILVTSNALEEWMFKVSDMGEAHAVLDSTYKSSVSHTQRNAVGTLPYQAPELLSGGNPVYKKPIDVYSFAMVMYELGHVDQHYPWHKDCSSNIVRIRSEVIAGKRPKVHYTVNPAYDTLMENCWCHVPDKRPDFLEIEQRLTYGEEEPLSSPALCMRVSPAKCSSGKVAAGIGPKIGKRSLLNYSLLLQMNYFGCRS